MAFRGAGACASSFQNLTRMIQYSVDLYARLEQETGQSVGWIQKDRSRLQQTQIV